MKKFTTLLGMLTLVLGLAFAAPKVQDEGTYIDNFGPKDSSYAQTDLLDFAEDATEEKESSNTLIFVIVGVVVVAGVVVAVTRKKKK